MCAVSPASSLCDVRPENPWQPRATPSSPLSKEHPIKDWRRLPRLGRGLSARLTLKSCRPAFFRPRSDGDHQVLECNNLHALILSLNYKLPLFIHKRQQMQANDTLNFEHKSSSFSHSVVALHRIGSISTNPIFPEPVIIGAVDVRQIEGRRRNLVLKTNREVNAPAQQ